MQNDKSKALIDSITDSINTLATMTDATAKSDLFKTWLRAVSRFHHYSFNNQLLGSPSTAPGRAGCRFPYVEVSWPQRHWHSRQGLRRRNCPRPRRQGDATPFHRWTDVHCGAEADGFKAFEDLNVLASVAIVVAVHGGRAQNFSRHRIPFARCCVMSRVAGDESRH